jgi:hypothetical protein
MENAMSLGVYLSCRHSAAPRRSHSDIYTEECHVPGCIFLPCGTSCW